jgi:hypothetical protein
MKGFGRLGGLGRRAGSAARKLRNRAGQFAFTGGKKKSLLRASRPGARQRLANRAARRFGRAAAVRSATFRKAFNKATDASDRWMGNHPGMAAAAAVAVIASAGFAGQKVGRFIGNKIASATNKKRGK